MKRCVWIRQIPLRSGGKMSRKREFNKKGEPRKVPLDDPAFVRDYFRSVSFLVEEKPPACIRQKYEPLPTLPPALSLPSQSTEYRPDSWCSEASRLRTSRP